MPGKSMPTWPKDKPIDGMPTFEDLLQQSGIPYGKLRLMLRGVPHWRCSDKAVRYDPTAAAAALEPYDDEEPDAPANDNAPDNDVAPPLPSDPTAATLVLYQRATQQTLLVMQRTLTAQNDVIKQMAEPLRMGMQLVKEAQGVLRGRLGRYDKMWDRMVLITEELQSTKAERDIKAQRDATRAGMQREAFDQLKKYLPDVLAKFSLTMEAGYALELARNINPAHLEAFLGLPGAVPEATLPLAHKLLEMMKARRQNAPIETEGTNAKPEEPATTASSSTEAATGNEPAAAPAAEEMRPDPANSNGHASAATA